MNLINDLFAFLTGLNSTNAVLKKVIFSSSVKDYFMTHIDFHLVSHEEPVVGNKSQTVAHSLLEMSFFLPMDMRFAGPDATFGVIELVGPGRAAQYLLTCLLADSPTAARIGWINDMFLNVTELEKNSNNLAE
ncbi:hypothetical protein ACSS6W_009731 [Trichoderma asperelloides]